jgi:hypothetical protein
VKIDGANYMHLNHAYAVMDADADRITLLNPNGKNAGQDRQSYSPELEKKAAHLEEVLQELSKELEHSKHKTFSQESKEAMQEALAAFYIDNKRENEKQGYNNRDLKKLYKVWNRITSNAMLQGELWKIDRKNIKNIEKNLFVYRDDFVTSQFRKGFKSGIELEISATQKISHQVLCDFFSDLSVFKLK